MHFSLAAAHWRSLMAEVCGVSHHFNTRLFLPDGTRALAGSSLHTCTINAIMQAELLSRTDRVLSTSP